MNTDDRLQAPAVNFELAHRDIQDLLTMGHQHGENIGELITGASRMETSPGLHKLVYRYTRAAL